MSRATLGHTGRPLHAPRPIVASYLLVSAAAIVRLAAALGAGESALPLLVLSGALWSLAFAAFAVRLGPALLQPRVDGRPG